MRDKIEYVDLVLDRDAKLLEPDLLKLLLDYRYKMSELTSFYDKYERIIMKESDIPRIIVSSEEPFVVMMREFVQTLFNLLSWFDNEATSKKPF